MMDDYVSSNYLKHTTKNRLKRAMNDRYSATLVRLLHRELAASRYAGGCCRLLDAGCGEGFVADILLAQFPQIQYLGLDHNSAAIAYARSRHAPGFFAEGDLYNLDFPDFSFDISLCLEVLEHLEQPQLALREVLRVTRHTAVISVPHEPFFRLGGLLTLRNIRSLGNPVDHINHWTLRGFKRLLEQNGLLIKSMTPAFPWNIAVVERRD